MLERQTQHPDRNFNDVLYRRQKNGVNVTLNPRSLSARDRKRELVMVCLAGRINMLAAVFSVMITSVRCAIDADEIKALPGWEGDLPSKQYSGYLEVPGDRGSKFYHYWFVESEGNPKTDPVGLWLNGGPGSSSLIGFLTENGGVLLYPARACAHPFF